MNPGEIFIKDFTYELPEEKIARFPLARRDASKLLIYRDKQIAEDGYNRVADHISPGSLLVFNDTKVLEARILFRKPTGAGIEIFCLEPDDQYPDIGSAMLRRGQVLWKCLVGGVSKWKTGQLLEKEMDIPGGKFSLSAKYIRKEKDCFLIALSWEPGNLCFAEALHYAGLIPLPPYLKRGAEDADRDRYQTIYAMQEGSVAAPTAGLHFTGSLFSRLAEKNIGKTFVTLHVGAGTFKPVSAKTIAGHDMHAECIEVSQATISLLLEKMDAGIIAVGTTSLRTLESLYWLGLKTILQPSIPVSGLAISQWDDHQLASYSVPEKEALASLLAWMKKNELQKLITKTQLLIIPGYRFSITRTLITNFHQPQSTLLLLVAALVGEDWKKIYRYALEKDFRFLSYGDGCLLFG